MSPKTVHNALILLRVMLSGKRGGSAIKRGFLRLDPTKGGRTANSAASQDPSASCGDGVEAHRCRRGVGESRRALVYLDAYTGLRRNEILALHFADIDWNAPEIIVQKAISKQVTEDTARKQVWTIGPPKSMKTVRRVALPDEARDSSKRLPRSARDPDGLIFRRADSSIIDPDIFDE